MIEGSDELVSTPPDGEKPVFGFVGDEARKDSLNSNGQPEEGPKKKEKERLKKERSKRMDAAKSVASSFSDRGLDRRNSQNEHSTRVG
jgi:hypothetical protein